MLRRYQIENSEDRPTSQDEKAPILLYVNPDEAEKRRLVDTYQIDEHTLASALDPDEQARLECEPGHIAFIYKRPKNYSGDDQLLFKAATMGVFFFGEMIILVVADDTTLFEGKQLARVEQRPRARHPPHLPGDLPLHGAPPDHQPDRRRRRAEDQPGHGEQVPHQPVRPAEEPGLLPERGQLQRRPHRQDPASTRPSSGSPRRRWSFSTTSPSRTTSATGRPKSTRTSWPA